MRVLGLDEAGRGCVLGPLVVGGFVCEDSDVPALEAAGVDDSKALSAKRRVAIRAVLPSLGDSYLKEVSPQAIDGGNINTLEEDAFFAIIAETRPDHVIIDAPCNPRAIPAFAARLSSRLRAAGVALPGFTIEPKADANYAVVGAASIHAKVHRDAQIAALGAVGSGYPSDPVTRAWLMGFLERDERFPPCVRTRWGTIEALKQQRLFER
jgi:ribonuclease HII